MDFTVIERAGITQQQFADLVGVSRVTVYTWLHNRFKPRPAMRARVERALQLLSSAINSQQLPVPHVDHRAYVEARLSKIATALHERS